jgi:hypothetical protein
VATAAALSATRRSFDCARDERVCGGSASLRFGGTAGAAVSTRFVAAFGRSWAGRRATGQHWVLWKRYPCASHGGAIFNHGASVETRGMTGESTKRKDTLKVEKVSLLVLSLCVVVLVYVLVARPF